MKRSDIHKINIYEKLVELCSGVHIAENKYDEWFKTREISDECNISIYSARLYLLELVREGKVLCSGNSVHNSLRWYPVLSKKGIDEIVVPSQKKLVMPPIS